MFVLNRCLRFGCLSGCVRCVELGCLGKGSVRNYKTFPESRSYLETQIHISSTLIVLEIKSWPNFLHFWSASAAEWAGRGSLRLKFKMKAWIPSFSWSAGTFIFSMNLATRDSASPRPKMHWTPIKYSERAGNELLLLTFVTPISSFLAFEREICE